MGPEQPYERFNLAELLLERGVNKEIFLQSNHCEFWDIKQNFLEQYSIEQNAVEKIIGSNFLLLLKKVPWL